MGTAISKLLKNMNVTYSTFESSNKMIESTGMSLRDLQLLASNNSTDFKKLTSSLGLTQAELKASMSTVQKFTQYAETAGMTTKEFADAYGEDAVEALGLFISGLDETEKHGKNAVEILQEMGLTEVRLSNAILALSSGEENLASAVKMANEAWEENNALTNEASKFYETTENKMKVLGNSFDAIKIKIFDSFRDPFKEAVVDMIDVLNNFESELGGSKFQELFASAGEAVGKMLVDIAKGLVEIMPDLLELIANLAKLAGRVVPSVIRVLTAVLKPIIKIANYLAKNEEVLTGLITALIAYKTTQKLATAGMVAYEAISKVLKVALGQATAAQVGLNVAMKANVIGLVVGLVAGLVTWLVKAAKKTKEATKEEKELAKTLDKLNDELEEVENSYKDMLKARNESMKAAQRESNEEEELWEELQRIVTANGEIKKGYEDRAAFIVGELNNAYGTEITILDGVIQKYQEVGNEIDNLRNKKRAAAIIESSDEAALEAEQGLQDLGYDEAKKTEATTRTAYENAAKQYLLLKEYDDLLNKSGKTKEDTKRINELRETLRGQGISSLRDFEKAYDKAEKDYNKTYSSWKEAQSVLAGMQEQVDNYKQVIDENQRLNDLWDAGDYGNITFDDFESDYNLSDSIQEEIDKVETQVDKISALLDDYVGEYDKLTGSSRTSRGKMIENEIKRLNTVRNSLLNSYRNAESEADKKIYLDAINDVDNTIKKYVEGSNAMIDIWGGTITQLLEGTKAENIKFEDAGEGLVQAFVNGQKVGSPIAIGEMEDLITMLNQKIKDGQPITADTITELMNGLSLRISAESITWEENTDGLMQAMVNGIAVGQPLTETQMETVMKTLRDKIAEGVPLTQAEVETLLAGMATTIEEDTEVETASSDLSSIVKNTFLGNLDAKGIATNFLSGLWTNLTSGLWFDKVKSAAVSLGSMLNIGVNKGQDAHSPSRKAIQSATYFVQGLLKGLTDQEDKVLNEAKWLGNELNNQLNASLGSVKSNLSASVGLGTAANGSFGGASVSNVTNFTQNITTPKPMSRLELYQENKRIAGLLNKGMVNNI